MLDPLEAGQIVESQELDLTRYNTIRRRLLSSRQFYNIFSTWAGYLHILWMKICGWFYVHERRTLDSPCISNYTMPEWQWTF
jgi:hypothetical protein